jgi:predicted ATPase/DNA-binding XRE family transcriptional regulator
MSMIVSFGEWIRRRRKALDLTQAALASRVDCAVITIKKIEQDERRPSQLLAERLADGLEIPADERAVFIQAALAQRSPDRLPAPADQLPSAQVLARLPSPATPLIGRRREIAQAVNLLHRAARLLTLTGAGGVGKTRLALAVAEKLAPEQRNGAAFISLSSLNDPDALTGRIAEELGAKQTGDRSALETLVDFLAGQQILLVLDNFEHLLPAAPQLASLLQALDGVRLLVTSREPLRLTGETVLTVKPLGLPGLSGAASTEQFYLEATRSDAVRLFASRARARSPDFHLNRENCARVADICRRLDGLPLAIELAAARTGEMPLEMLQDGLVQRLDLIGGGYQDLPERQRTLRSTFDWSFNLLLPAEKQVFPRLGVFAGGITLEAVRAVCPEIPADQLQAALAGLAGKNMIYLAADGERYHLLETAQTYAREHLTYSGEIQAAQKAHLIYFAKLAEEAAPHFWDKEQAFWLRRMSNEVDNLRRALGWALDPGSSDPEAVESGARMAASLWYFWYLYGALNEGAGWLGLALERLPQPGRTRAQLLMAEGTLAWQQGRLLYAADRLRQSLDLFRRLEDSQGLAESTHMYGHIVFDQQNYAGADQYFRESLALYEELGDRTLRVSLISDLGLVAYHQGSLEDARKYYQESLSLFIEAGIKDGEAQSCIRLGDIARLEGEYPKAQDLYQKSLKINRELNISMEIACSLHKLGFIALWRGETLQAWKLFLESLSLQAEFGNQQGIAECLAGLASAFAAGQRYEEAARCFAAARQILEKTGLPISPADLIEWRRDEAAARSHCDPLGFEQAWAQGSVEMIDGLVAELLTENWE